MISKEDIYNAFGLSESDLNTIRSSKESIELQLKVYEEKQLRKLRLINA